MSRLYVPDGTAWAPLAAAPGPGPDPGPTGILFGINVGKATTKSPNRDPSLRLQQYGRIPTARVFNTGMLPNSISSAVEGAFAPEKRWGTSFKGNAASIAAGDFDGVITNYAMSVPVGSECTITYHHEPNGDFNNGSLNLADWKAATIRMSKLLWSLPTRDRVFPCIIFSAPKGTAEVAVPWNDSWLIPFAQMENPHAILSWDSYGNPNGGLGLDSQYPTMQWTFDNVFEKSALGGYDVDGRWGITETGTPLRNWDTNGVARTQWFTDAINYLSSHTSKPRHIYVWEGAATWDHTINTASQRLPWKTAFATSI